MISPQQFNFKWNCGKCFKYCFFILDGKGSSHCDNCGTEFGSWNK